MRKLLLLSVSTLILAGLGYDLGTRVAPAIENKISKSVADKLPNGTRHGASITVSGRDIEVSGVLHDGKERDALLQALEVIEGNREIRMQDVTLLPVAAPYNATLDVNDGVLAVKTFLPDEVTATRLKAQLGEGVNLDYTLASGMPKDNWPDLVGSILPLANGIETGKVSLSNTEIALSGRAKTRAVQADIDAYSSSLPDGYTLNTDAFEFPAPYQVSLTKEFEQPVRISGNAPKGVSATQLVTDLGLGAFSDEPFETNADGQIDDISAEIKRLSPILSDMRSYELTLSQEGTDPMILTGVAKATVDLEQFKAKRAELGLQSAQITIPKQFDVAFELDAETGAKLTGVAPDSFDAKELATSLGLKTIDTEELERGARGEASILADQFSSLKPVLEDLQTLSVDLEGEEGTDDAAAEVEAETLPNADPSRVASLISSIFTTLSPPKIEKTKKTYENGTIRTNGITGVKEKHFNGYWLPVLTVTGATSESCKAVTDSILERRQIVFESGLAILDPSARVTINRLAGVMSSCLDQTKMDVELSGHTDSQGDDEQNMRLSIFRVNAVRDALVERGLEFPRMLTIGYGETRPIADNSTPDGRKSNRRTELDWLTYNQPVTTEGVQ